MKDFKPLPGREFPRFSAIKTFFRLPQAELSEKFDVALFGIPFDGGASYRVGQRFGIPFDGGASYRVGQRFAPSGVREVSALGRGYHWSRDQYFPEKIKVADVGDAPTVPIDLQQTYSKVEKFATEILKSGKRFVACGGDHSVTLPLLRALKKHHGESVALIHFDAHFDTYPPAWDCDYHHGTFVRHAVKEKLIDPKLSVQIGVRGPFAAREDAELSKNAGITIWDIDTIRRKGVDALAKQWPKFGNRPVYISFDVDCLDPAFAPGTGTPVIGGMTSYEAQLLLRSLPKLNLVGGDVVEVIPQYDVSEITQLFAVDVMFELISIMGTSSKKG